MTICTIRSSNSPHTLQRMAYIKIWSPKQLTMDLGGGFHGGMEAPILVLEVAMVAQYTVAARWSL